MPVSTYGKRVTQTIDLKEVFGKNVGDINLKQKIGQFFIDTMKERIQSGKDVNGESFTPYSKSYKESINFQAARKSGDVNLKLSGDMLGSIDILSISGNKIKIGFNDRMQELKAHGHMTGGGKNNTLPIREFFGVNNDDLSEAADKFGKLIKK